MLENLGYLVIGEAGDGTAAVNLARALKPDLVLMDIKMPELDGISAAQTLAHHLFRDLPSLLSPGDLLVLNDTRVLPARLLGYREATGGKWEGLFLKAFADGAWEMLGQTRGRLVSGDKIAIEPGPLELTFAAHLDNGRCLTHMNVRRA